ncbi:MAG: VWA domain-containing protein [Candidatus Nanopelagicales bacterium]
MYLPLLYRLRAERVPVGTTEALALGRALAAGAHRNSVTGYYHVARAILIHHEGHLDAFDRAFAAEYRGLLSLSDEMREWLDEVAERGERAAGDAELPDLDELLAEYQKRLREQTERHDGGPYWIGTGGTSPFGQGGSSASGLSTGSSGGGRAAIQVADARRYRGYRSDVTLDIRQLEVALRRLRAFVRDGAADELDIDATIDATARNAGEIEVVTRPPSRPNTHVILMIDVGGSMYPYTELMSQLFSATKKATHFKELRTYYFHNTIYGQVYATTSFAEPITIPDLMRQCASHYKLIMVGDALMAPYELHSGGHWSVAGPDDVSGLGWLRILREHFTDAVWLNPEPAPGWPGTTIEDIGEVMPMFGLTVDGLTEGMALLNRGARR